MQEVLDENIRDTEFKRFSTQKMNAIAVKLVEAKKQIRKSRNRLYAIAGYVLLSGLLSVFFSPYFEIVLDKFLLSLTVAAILGICALSATKNGILAFSAALVVYVLFELFFVAEVPHTLVNGVVWKLGMTIVICIGLYYAISAHVLQKEWEEAALES